ncbi:hypothetical protein A3A09_03675 [Candidatus Nomurabacteria bacterium RIFCSPLOWO2_01_FULL_42_20]|uniref:Uncharacterized protein n=1 Tax=Candidatus Nomurabacteria bacterium RIFCSPHIGHO2_01_FULL_42_16 TaxID=1801743 RepID=A0A1F6VI46_9BACT|nr:MAG: hypothetical protein A2824_00840 [Candidatus Nomurabacteria bacterium RIFCSPHIGHO2_01_FULL_42_16]OGI91406.1 MAG: hypothetical protein A3A09_03675 [Candidatus Nomurabacteria bacterium RIFCSPLOWO2_01_FULL_42_20]
MERNPVRARLVKKAELWKWSSLYRRINGTEKQKKLLSDWPFEIPEDYLLFVNEPLEKEMIEEIRQSTKRERPLGNQKWREDMIKKYGLEYTERNKGRPRKSS